MGGRDEGSTGIPSGGRACCQGRWQCAVRKRHGGHPGLIEKRIPQIERLADDLHRQRIDLGRLPAQWSELKANLSSAEKGIPSDWEGLWREMHQIRRAMVLKNPLFDVGPLLFVKHVPSVMSHQLTQVYGYAARPGGGIFVLDEPGRSMEARSLTEGQFPDGNFMHSEVSYDGQKIYFAFCEAERSPERWRDPATMDRYYQVYEMLAEGKDVRKLTEGSFDHFNPTCLPDGGMIGSESIPGLTQMHSSMGRSIPPIKLASSEGSVSPGPHSNRIAR